MLNKKHKILVVEDDCSLSGALCDILNNHGYEVIPAYAGNEALDKLNSEKPELVLLDIMLPDISGLGILSKMRETEEFRNTPVYLLTVLTDTETIQQGVALGIRGYLVKSDYKIDEVLQKVNEVFND